jgi:anti-sigma factor RsiW
MSAASCDEVTDLLEPFADGELALPDQEAVALHVRGCAECQLHLEELRVLRGKLKRLPPYRAPAGLASRIADKLAERHEPARRTAWPAWSMPVASHLAAALIGLAAGYWILLGADQSDSLSRELVAAHVRSLMAAQPIDVASGDPHRVGPWFAGRLDFAPKVRDLAAQGFPLVGGRVDYFDGRRVAAVVFRRRDHVINVFIMPHASGPMRHDELRRNGYNIESWSDGEYDFWAVSDLNRDELDMLTKLLGA